MKMPYKVLPWLTMNDSLRMTIEKLWERVTSRSQILPG